MFNLGNNETRPGLAAQQPSTSQVLAPSPLAIMPAPTGTELPRGSPTQVRLAQLAAIILNISARRSTHLLAVNPRLAELSLPEQWAATVAELDRLAVRVVELDRALVAVGLRTNATRAHLSGVQLQALTATATSATIEPSLRGPATADSPHGCALNVDEYVAMVMAAPGRTTVATNGSRPP